MVHFAQVYMKHYFEFNENIIPTWLGLMYHEWCVFSVGIILYKIVVVSGDTSPTIVFAVKSSPSIDGGRGISQNNTNKNKLETRWKCFSIIMTQIATSFIRIWQLCKTIYCFYSITLLYFSLNSWPIDELGNWCQYCNTEVTSMEKLTRANTYHELITYEGWVGLGAELVK